MIFSVQSEVTTVLEPFKTHLPKNERVYYSRTLDGVPKNSLYTILDNKREYIYFGIARCNLAQDSCVKKYGKQLARQRALAAIEKYNDLKIFVHKDETFGKIEMKCKDYLLNFFYSLDKIA